MNKDELREQILRDARVTQVGEIISTDKQKGKKRKSAAQAGVSSQNAIDLMLKIRDGVLTTIRLSLDGRDDSEAYISLRILSAKEELDIKYEMAETGLIPDTNGAYELLLAAKRISRASSTTQNPLPSDLGSQPLLSEDDLINIVGEHQLIALGYKYVEFLNKHSPKLRQLTQEDLDDIVNTLGEALDLDPKSRNEVLRQIFCDLDLNVTHEVLIYCVKSLKTHAKLTDKLHTGTL